ncbi:MAG TPA: hypothetical protein VHO48_14420, partial [Anaerolineaceae bacterium]|nr:hypothetical protein [Anaerolineaceae bacterium]
MTRTVVALYDTLEDAKAAVREMVDNGFSRDDISLMANDMSGEYGRYLSRSDVDRPDVNETSSAAEGAGVGASVGAALGGIGGLLVGLGALTIPGIGPVIAAGPLAAALAGLAGAGAGALAGGVTGGLIGALVESGVPEETAQYYSEGVRRGGTLLTVRADETMSGRAVNIMNRHNPVDINSRATQWRGQGWTGFRGEERRSTDMAGGVEETGTIRGVVDSDMESTEERYGTEQNIPTTGDRDRTYGSAGMTGQPPSSTGTDPERNFSQGGSRAGDLGNTGGREGMMGHDRSTSYDRDVPNQPAGRDFSTTGREGTMGTTGQESPGDLNRGDEIQGGGHDHEFGQTGSRGMDYSTGGYRDFTYYDTAFRNHFSAGVYGTTYDYDQFRPAYRYGYDLASDPRYADRTWEDIEPEARRYWDEREPGAWERFKDSIREAWNQVK